MSAADRLNEIEARANAATDDVRLERYRHGGGRLANFSMNSDRQLVADFYGEADREFYTAARTDVPALVAALRAVLEVLDKRGKQAREALPPSLAALAVPSYQFNVRASDVIRAIEEALS